MKSLKPQLRFPEFSDDWQVKKISDAGIAIIDGDRGENYPNGNDFSVSGYCLFLNAKNVTKRGFSFEENSFISSEKDKILRKGKLSRQDIVLTTRGSIGNVAYYDGSITYDDVRINSGMVLLRPDQNTIKSIYLNSLTQSIGFSRQVERISFGSAQPQLTVAGIAKIRISIPSIDEQEKIAGFLTAVDDRVAAQQQKVELLKKYKKGVMQKIFTQQIHFNDETGQNFPTWQVNELGRFATIKTGGLNVDDAIEDGKYIFFDRSEEIKKFNEYSFDNEALIYPGEGSKFLPRYFNGKYGLHQRAYTIFDAKDVNMKYLYFYMLTQNNHFLRMAVGSTVKSLRMDCFTKCPVPVPAIEEQQKIADFLTSLDDKIKLEEAKLTTAKTFKKGLLQRMFV